MKVSTRPTLSPPLTESRRTRSRAIVISASASVTLDTSTRLRRQLDSGETKADKKPEACFLKAVHSKQLPKAQQDACLYINYIEVYLAEQVTPCCIQKADSLWQPINERLGQDVGLALYDL